MEVGVANPAGSRDGSQPPVLVWSVSCIEKKVPKMEPSIVEGTLRSGVGGPGADGSIRFSLASPATTDKKVGQFKRFRRCRGGLGRRRLRVITFSDQTAAAFVETDGRNARLDRAFRKSGRRRQRNSGVVQFGYRQNSVRVGHRIKRNVSDADRRRRHWLPGRNGSTTASRLLLCCLMALLVAGRVDGRLVARRRVIVVVPAVEDVVSAVYIPLSSS